MQPIENEQNLEQSMSHFIGIRFRGGEKSYYFGTSDGTIAQGDVVIVETADGYEAATVCAAATPLSQYRSSFELKPILRKATKSDLAKLEFNRSFEKHALEVTRKNIAYLHLPMDLIDAVSNFDADKVTITYTSTEKRVDFRELLHMIVPALSCRVELRQIASRDKARMIGGIGICGLPLCCSTFLTSFEGISIQRAKNQMLTLNIPKLSGPCGKLICCLLFEDDAYTQEKKKYPSHGTRIHTPDGDYSVDSFNVLSRTVRLVNATRDDYKTYPLDDILAMQNGTYRKKAEESEKSSILPDFGIGLRDASYGGMHPDKLDNTHYAQGANRGSNDNGKGQGNRNNREKDNRRGNRNDRQNHQDRNPNRRGGEQTQNNQNRNQQQKRQDNRNRNANGQNPGKDQRQNQAKNENNRAKGNNNNRNFRRNHGNRNDRKPEKAE